MSLITIPMRQEGEDSYVLFVILSDDNINRIKSYDPAEIHLPDMGKDFNRLDLKGVNIMYASNEEIEEMIKNPRDVVKMILKLARGWSFRPDLGDHDGPPVSFGPFSR